MNLSKLEKKLKRAFLPARYLDAERIMASINTLKNDKNQLLFNAICDPNGLGGLDLKLENAHIPKQYYEIFYKMFLANKNHLKLKTGGGFRF